MKRWNAGPARANLAMAIARIVAIGFAAGAVVPAQAVPTPSSSDPASAANDSSSQGVELGTINVIAVSPAQGASLPANKVPYGVQTATSGQFDQAQVLDATDYMNRRMAGVTINSAQGNPLQPDVQMRGFTGTPLLGGAQGISVYLDGVRVNEVFGDTVNWDLIPEEAMSKMSLMSGANPIFGLNTLGGAIQIQSKTGFSDPGAEVQAYAGSFGRVETTAQAGGNNGDWGYYLLANHFEEDGWRDLSGSKATTLLTTLSWRGEGVTADLHLTHAETQLTGNGAQQIDLLRMAPRSVFTAPDLTKNYYSGVTAQATYSLNEATSFSATVFARQVDALSYNGDATDFDLCDGDVAHRCNEDGTYVLDQNGGPLPARYDAINNIGTRKQLSYGGSLQAVFKQSWFGLQNQMALGIDVDHGRVDYRSELEAATLVSSLSRPYSLGTSYDSDVVVPDAALAVHIDDVNGGVYATDTLSLTDKLSVTLSGRYNHTHIAISDASGENPDLDGDHTFHRVNPAFGVTYEWSRAINFYGGYSESTRAPTPVELTCASPDAPCKLPNDFLSDPALKQVVAKSWEAGLRGVLDGADERTVLQWQLGFYRTTNHDDILFQTTGGALSNEGYFANVGDTRRQGLEASVSGKLFDNRLDWSANYNYLDATYLTSFTEISRNNPNADAETGAIQVNKGDRIPSLPKNTFKLAADFTLTQNWSIGGDLQYNASQYLRGDEANSIAPLGGFCVANLHAGVRVSDHLRFFARLDNVFDRRYANFGVLGNATHLYPTATDARFVGPGQPRGGWVGVAVEL